MNKARREAVDRHRRRREDQGIQRLEISVAASDKPLFRELAAVLREGGNRAQRLRAALHAAAQDAPKRSFLDFLQSGPEDELERPSPPAGMRNLEL